PLQGNAPELRLLELSRTRSAIDAARLRLARGAHRRVEGTFYLPAPESARRACVPEVHSLWPQHDVGLPQDRRASPAAVVRAQPWRSANRLFHRAAQSPCRVPQPNGPATTAGLGPH